MLLYIKNGRWGDDGGARPVDGKERERESKGKESGNAMIASESGEWR